MGIFDLFYRRDTWFVSVEDSGNGSPKDTLTLHIGNMCHGYSVESLTIDPVTNITHGKDRITIERLFNPTTYWAKGYSTVELGYIVDMIRLSHDQLMRSHSNAIQATLEALNKYNESRLTNVVSTTSCDTTGR